MKKLLLSVMCLAAMWSCNTQDPENGKIDAGNTYMKLSLKMETKSSTDDNSGSTNSNANPDFEVGKDYENKVSSVDIVLYNETTGQYIPSAVVAPAETDTYVASFKSTDLVASASYTIYIYANCKAPNTFNLDATSETSVADMTKNSNFWMTNAEAAQEITLPGDLSPYTQPQTPFNLGTHKVERSMARFDYKAVNEGNVYTIGTGVNITLKDAALINQSKNHYMLRRVSADGTNTNWTVGGAETSTNYVVDTDYTSKSNGYSTDLANSFDNHMTTQPSTWTWKSLTGLTDDNWSGTEGDQQLDGFQILQYAKENTIPNIEAQEKGITTAIVFKGEITATKNADENLQNALNSKKRIYVFNNVLYGTWENVATAATADNADATLKAAYNAAKEGMNEEEQDPDVTKAAEAKFTGYSPDTDGKYYAYYYYYNRHNDNLKPYEMGVMEYAVVRNNVYKLCVDKIAKFGHPTPNGTDPDPNPENPEDPDESVDYYFNVTVKVLPWVVRVNHIEF